MIKLVNLAKSFGTQELFDSVNYSFPRGERVALVGANGAGKTTLIDIVSGFTPADDGEVEIPKNVRIGYLPQNPNPSPLATVIDECESGDEELFRLKKQMDIEIKKLESSNDNLHEYEKLESA